MVISGQVCSGRLTVRRQLARAQACELVVANLGGEQVGMVGGHGGRQLTAAVGSGCVARLW